MGIHPPVADFYWQAAQVVTRACAYLVQILYKQSEQKPMLFTINNIAKAYGDNQVLNQASFTLDHGQKLGLVGANGVGKSTLLKIIVGELEPDSGEAWVANGAEVGYLPQVLAAAGDQTIDQLIDGALGNRWPLAAQIGRVAVNK